MSQPCLLWQKQKEASYQKAMFDAYVISLQFSFSMENSIEPAMSFVTETKRGFLQDGDVWRMCDISLQVSLSMDNSIEPAMSFVTETKRGFLQDGDVWRRRAEAAARKTCNFTGDLDGSTGSGQRMEDHTGREEQFYAAVD